MLLELQDLNRVRLGNKFTKQHVQFQGKTMNVRLAVQTLSKSIADASDVFKEKFLHSKIVGLQLSLFELLTNCSIFPTQS